MNNMQPESRGDMLDVLFAQRNREYGAYKLRREYPKNMLLAFVIAPLPIGILFAICLTLSTFFDSKTEEEAASTGCCLCPPTISMQFEKIIWQSFVPTRPTIRFVPPVVVPDKLAPDGDWMPPTSKPDLVVTEEEVAQPMAENVQEHTSDCELVEAELNAEPIYEIFDLHILPSFPGGQAAMFKWVHENLKFRPPTIGDAIMGGLIVIEFVVDKNGNIVDAHIRKAPDNSRELAAEVLRVVQSMPQWMPGENNGRAVSVRFVLPIRIELR